MCYNATMNVRPVISLPEDLLAMVDTDAANKGMTRAEWFRRAAAVYLTFEPKKIEVTTPKTVFTTLIHESVKDEVAKPCKHSDYPAKTGFGDNKTCGNCGVAWDWKEARWR